MGLDEAVRDGRLRPVLPSATTFGFSFDGLGGGGVKTSSEPVSNGLDRGLAVGPRPDLLAVALQRRKQDKDAPVAPDTPVAIQGYCVLIEHNETR